MLPSAIFLFLFALAILWIAARQRDKTGLPGGQVIYEDTREWGPVEAPLYDPLLRLTGKPDYLVQQPDGSVIPVEVKSNHVHRGPYDSHIYQLAAYCYLVTRDTGQRPSYGILHYPNRTYRIDYTPDLEANFLDLVAEMRADERRRNVSRSHESVARCGGCGFEAICDHSLV